MSRSYRKPFMAITGLSPATWDKQRAARNVRRVQNRVLRNTTDYENLLLPHFRDCPWNDVWSWKRDGNQKYYNLERARRRDGSVPDWYFQMQRK